MVPLPTVQEIGSSVKAMAQGAIAHLSRRTPRAAFASVVRVAVGRRVGRWVVLGYPPH